MQNVMAMLNRCGSRIVQVIEKNRFTVMRITSHSAVMDRRDNLSSPWLALLAVGLALATLAPVAIVASQFV